MFCSAGDGFIFTSSCSLHNIPHISSYILWLQITIWLYFPLVQGKLQSFTVSLFNFIGKKPLPWPQAFLILLFYLQRSQLPALSLFYFPLCTGLKYFLPSASSLYLRRLDAWTLSKAPLTAMVGEQTRFRGGIHDMWLFQFSGMRYTQDFHTEYGMPFRSIITVGWQCSKTLYELIDPCMWLYTLPATLSVWSYANDPWDGSWRINFFLTLMTS